MTRPESSLIRARRLASRIRAAPHHMPTPCSNCSRRGDDCLVNLSSGRCSACNDRNAKCDLVVSQPEWDRIDCDKEKLRRQLEKAQDEAIETRRRLLLADQEAQARERRLRRELAQIDSKEKEMFDREMASIREVQALEQEEARSRSQGLRTPQPAVSGAASPSFSGFEWNVLHSPYALDPVLEQAFTALSGDTSQLALNYSSSS
ncbi:hypothetical protein K469DRAFT_101304 [Zopfia rhizophila CBS 207.26]|uniref:Zn(2)-C6 fungal-type domain-containing protein n=1 Tax=Zopfia rhizophila CBS 207.26 TaxID=1314779 RepID=A0A6A6D5S3_9PEZI|nr:hypothetical protein K469DRAFT_101304 [Zopfia rhizophila CBS 207.26]